MDQVFIHNLSARGIIGVRDWEREKPQEILINVTVFANLQKAGETDNLADCIDYSKLAKKIIAHAELVRRYTVEALAADLAKICLENTGVLKVKVKVEKPGAVRFAQSVGVEIERSKAA
jgi:FolB domain-containing protein